MANELRTEIAMRSQLGEISDVIERLRSDPEVLSRICGREAAFIIAMREALANSITHGNRHDGFKKVYVQYACEPDNSLSILIRMRETDLIRTMCRYRRIWEKIPDGEFP